MPPSGKNGDSKLSEKIMPTPREHITFQTRIHEYAEATGWMLVSREEAEQRRGFDPVPPKDRAKGRSLFFNDLLDAEVWEFNPCYREDKSVLLGQFRRLHTDIYGNRDLVTHLRNRGKFFDVDAKRERDLINYSDKVEGICLNHRTPSQLVSVKDYA